MLILDDYNHRWVFIRKASKGIYIFCKVLFYEIPKFIIITVPWEIFKASKRGIVRLYKAIPPLKEWPGIISRAVVSMLRGIKHFLIAVGKGIKATPRALYETGQYIVKRTWKGIKALPHLAASAIRNTWAGLKIIGIWLKDFFLRYFLFATVLMIVLYLSFTLLYPRLWISSAQLLLQISLPD